MTETGQSFLGRGWQFPPSFSRSNHAAQMVTGVADIEQSLHIILGTIPGERIMQPAFGCPTQNFVFQQVDTRFVNRLNDTIQHALLMLEPRIKFIRAEINHHNALDGVLYISIHFLVKLTNTRHNIVYPFYLNEATNLPDTI